MKNGFIIDTLTSVDIQEIFKIERRVIQIYEVVIYWENFKMSSSRKIRGKLFALRKKILGRTQRFDAILGYFNHEQFVRSSNTQKL